MSREPEAGFALVSVLSVVLILSLLAGSLVLLARTQTRSAALDEQRAKAAGMADAAIHRAVLGLTDKRMSARWTYDGAPREVEVPGGAATVTVTDELGRIDLNSADDPLLRALFVTAGLKPEEAAAMIDVIRDWTDEDDLRRLNGAEAEDYRMAGLRYVPRNQPFELVEELKLVKGMTGELYAKVAPALTLYSGRRSVDSRRAGGLVRQVLRLTDETNNGQADQTAPAQPVVESLGGRAFRLHAEVDAGHGNRVARETIIRFTDDPRNPFWVHGWMSTMPGSKENSQP